MDSGESEKSEGFNLPKEEEKILEFWKTNDIFGKSLVKNIKSQGTKIKSQRFVFYEGPPYANGRPGIHHVLARVYKDVILRYKTMRGYYVPRRAGWDTHGLPVEIAAEKALGLKSKKDIEKYGVERFNQEAKKAVWFYKDEWEKMTERIGYWLDLKNAYVTYEPEYIETLWWTISQVAKRGLLYKGHKVVPWCPRCGTALSSHELALGYKETTDNSVYVKFHLRPNQKFSKHITKDSAYILSWTTTPWTLPANAALVVGENIKYTALRIAGVQELYILASELVEKVFKDKEKEIEIVHDSIKGSDLVGLEYEPLFNVPSLKNSKSHRVYAADFVTTTDGTGVVHTAVMYGEDDYNLALKVGLPQLHTVDEEGRFTKDVPGGLGGLHVKSKEVEEKVIQHLTTRNYHLKTEQYTHEYPYCWRCETPIIYYARNSWFIAMSKLRNQLLASNKKINWVPDYIKEGRFGEWLREVKDWNLSRERYWGAPLPIWECKKCGQVDIAGSLDELSNKAGGAKNNYWTMRHGEAESNMFKIISDSKEGIHLTPRGRARVEYVAKVFQKEFLRNKRKIDLIISSDITRTRETAEIVRSILGCERLFLDERLEEIHLGVLEGCHSEKYHKLYPTYESKFAERPESGESLRDLRMRMWNFLRDCEKKYSGKNILLVGHEYPIWMMTHAASGWSEKKAIEEKVSRKETKQDGDFVETAEINKLDFKIIPRDGTGLVDLHRPYVDEVFLKCSKCGSRSERIKEVADVWYDSGAMPFAQGHWPFAQNQKSKIKNQKLPEAYPADYISEGMDQTRGWFYTLLAVATALGFEAPYKNVIALGLINDKSGQKMSKSRGNIVDPWTIINKYGVDAVRWYFYTVNPPGEPKNFDENDILKTYRRMHLILYNSIAFFNTYYAKSASLNKKASLKNILDQWALSRLHTTIAEATACLERYEVREAALSIERFVDDLSRWYIRRSRRRFQRPTSESDHRDATVALGYALRELGKLIAPFTPFFGEVVYEALGGGTSIHLEDWPVASKSKVAEGKELIEQMAEVRRLASMALAKRAEAGIKVRQPIASLKIKNQKSKIKMSEELMSILKDEVNVKKVMFDPKIQNEIELDTVITLELKEEGTLRDLVRMVQELRQNAGLKPRDQIVLMVEVAEPMKGIILRNESFIKSEVGAKTIDYKKSEKFEAEFSSEIDGVPIWIGLRRAQ